MDLHKSFNVILILAVCFKSVHLTDATVEVTGDFVCDEPASLVCKITPYGSSMLWKVNGDVVAQCVQTTCFPTNGLPGDHTFSGDTATGIFVLNITSVKHSHNGTVYTCNDGAVAEQITAEVKALPKQASTFVNEANEEIIVSTDCVYPPCDVRVTWYCVTDGQEQMIQHNKMTADGIDCTSGSCAGRGVQGASGSINVGGLNDGRSSYKAKVFIDAYRSRSISVSSSATYECVNTATTTATTTTTTYTTITTTTISSPATIADQTFTNPAYETTTKSLTSSTPSITRHGIANGQHGNSNQAASIIPPVVLGGVIVVLVVTVPR